MRVSLQEHSALLERNLRALASAGSDLAQRLTGPMLGTHLTRSPAERGRRAIERRHTVRARVRAMLDVLPTLRSP